ncbi:hypothetical protein AAFF_G00341390 [Aldrovandia affinis]|uniref:Uncharacterized protein n=1 Tax=Aldrovandia affinis TaxID=143900 RepID=A0AAD7WP87_9TELE|nr:hypothetical protein AAFF_G00341390 [Aldrovandia affinis]
MFELQTQCQAASYLQTLITPYTPARHLRSASSGKLTVPSLRAPGSRCSRSRLFSVLTPRWWNDLPQLWEFLRSLWMDVIEIGLDAQGLITGNLRTVQCADRSRWAKDNQGAGLKTPAGGEEEPPRKDSAGLFRSNPQRPRVPNATKSTCSRLAPNHGRECRSRGAQG